jgi:hypothetical protein
MDHLLGAEYSHEQIMSVLTKLGASTSAAQTEHRAFAADRKKLESWINILAALLCPVYFQSAAKLRVFAKSLLPVCPLPPKASEAVTRNALAEHLMLNPLTMGNMDMAQGVSASSLIAQLTKTQKLKHSFIVAAFLPKLETEARRDTRRGLDLEEPMVWNLLRDLAKQKTIFTIEEVAAAPLVCRTNLPIHSACCSLDFAATICHSQAGKRELAGIECMGRVRPSTAVVQKTRFTRAKEAMGVSQNEKYVVVDAMSEAFSCFVMARKEALQILHHAFCYNFQYRGCIAWHVHCVFGGIIKEVYLEKWLLSHSSKEQNIMNIFRSEWLEAYTRASVQCPV